MLLFDTLYIIALLCALLLMFGIGGRVVTLPKHRRLLVAVTTCFHMAILLAMNLISFSLIMISIELAMLSDTDWASVIASWQRWHQWVSALTKRALPRNVREEVLSWRQML